ncbi:MAG: gliding motility-associated C-terminal domain-containing protein [Bacteroidota bacterium]
MFNTSAKKTQRTALQIKSHISGIKLFLTFLLTILTVSLNQVLATHLRAGEIIAERVDCQGRTFRITIIVYTDTGSDVRFGEGLLDFGDGSEPFSVPIIENGVAARRLPNGTIVTENIDTDGLGNLVSSASFTIEHTYGSALPFFTIGYTEPNRNEGILNVDNSVNTTFHLETRISLDASLGCNDSPVLLIPPIDRGCPGVAFFHNPGAFDPNGDSLAFEIVIPKKDAESNVDGYEPVNDPMFYENFAQGNEDQDGQPIFEISPTTGEVTWDAPGRQGEYNIAFVVREFRFLFGAWRPLGFVRRDMQIIIEDCDNERPEITQLPDLCVEAGTFIEQDIEGFDPDGDLISITMASQVEELGAVLIPEADTVSSPATVRFEWDTECADIRDQPYQVTFRITDIPAEGPKLVSFMTWNITVVGPPPVWEADQDSLFQEGQGLRLNWESYECQNAEQIQVWRRVDTNPYIPEECETGIRENAGYELIATLPDNVTTYLDEDLDAAARYCYRLVAIFPNPPGGESIVSEERCFSFVPAEEPIITHVSVRRTDQANGEVSVTWREPFELGLLQSPYTFRVYRSTGLSGTGDETLVSQDIVRDETQNDSTSLTFVDTGLNTLNNPYHYRVAIVDPTGTDGNEEIFSAPASTVRLEPTPQFGQIQLDWEADVPWSNTIAFPPPPGTEHLVFRGLEGQLDEELTFLAAVDVNQFGFQYVDSVDLIADQVYCYRVLTRGTYGNPDITDPLAAPYLLNFSQTVCAQPSDSIPPCAPTLVLDGRDCEQYVSSNTCSNGNFFNELTWSSDFGDACQNDIDQYFVEFAPTTDSEFEPIQTDEKIRSESFIHDNLDSFKGCYRVRAVDRSGNLGEYSNVFCVDNCPYYELPNIFTPNNDECNDRFKAYSDTNTGENNTGPCGRVDATKCARFVLSVKFTVYNRWGTPVYTYQANANDEPAGPGLEPELINWDGRGDNGNVLSAGVYYYFAEVTFDVVDPGNAVQNYKGWVQILR